MNAKNAKQAENNSVKTVKVNSFEFCRELSLKRTAKAGHIRTHTALPAEQSHLFKYLQLRRNAGLLEQSNHSNLSAWLQLLA